MFKRSLKELKWCRRQNLSKSQEWWNGKRTEYEDNIIKKYFWHSSIFTLSLTNTPSLSLSFSLSRSHSHTLSLLLVKRIIFQMKNCFSRYFFIFRTKQFPPSIFFHWIDVQDKSTSKIIFLFIDNIHQISQYIIVPTWGGSSWQTHLRSPVRIPSSAKFSNQSIYPSIAKETRK